MSRKLVLLSTSWLNLIYLAASQTLPSPAICEDSIDGRPPFNSNDSPCLLRCNDAVVVPTGTLLPGMLNVTNIPYCQLDCVHSGATPSQSALAPDCYTRCHAHNQETPENVGWCMYWCVDGYGDLVETTACVPSLKYGSPVTSFDGTRTITYRPFTQPAEWQSWYETQTVMSRTGDFATVYNSPPSTSVTSAKSVQITISAASITTAMRTASTPSATSQDVWGLNSSPCGARSNLFSLTVLGCTVSSTALSTASTTSATLVSAVSSATAAISQTPSSAAHGAKIDFWAVMSLPTIIWICLL